MESGGGARVRRQLQAVGRVAAYLGGGFLLLSAASTAAVRSLRYLSDANQVSTPQGPTPNPTEVQSTNHWRISRPLVLTNLCRYQRKFATPCGSCEGKGTYPCRLCRGSSTVDWSPLYDPVFINPCLCPTCDGTRLVFFFYKTFPNLGCCGVSCDRVLPWTFLPWFALCFQGTALLELLGQMLCMKKIRASTKCISYDQFVLLIKFKVCSLLLSVAREPLYFSSGMYTWSVNELHGLYWETSCAKQNFWFNPKLNIKVWTKLTYFLLPLFFSGRSYRTELFWHLS